MRARPCRRSWTAWASPTAGVDAKARREFWDLIHDMAGDGLTVLVSTHYMDEAERCHQIAYIAYGHLLACGTVAEVIAQAALTCLTVQATSPQADMAGLARRLKELPGVDLVASFGAALHVGGADAGRLETALAPLRADPAFRWSPDAPTLEDVFIHLMTQSPDNFNGGAEA